MSAQADIPFWIHPIQSFLEDLVAIDSQVGNIDGILTVQKTVAARLEEMGFAVKFHENPQIQSAPLLVAQRKVSEQAPTLTFIGHSDVVTSVSKVPFSISEDKIFGAGVADDKGGLAVCLYALAWFLQGSNAQSININVVVSPNEETGSIGFHSIFKEIGEASSYVLGLEPALQCGSIISSRSGNRWYQIKTQGIGAHAGRFGSNYINAAHKLSLIISKLHAYNDEEKKRRLNVGSLSGGNNGFNTICDEAGAKLDVRFSSFECRDFLHQKILGAFESTSISCPYSGKTSSAFYSIEDDCPPLASGGAICWAANLLKNIEDFEGRSVQGIQAGGAADINYFAFPENKAIDGLGPIGGGLHTRGEYIEKHSLSTRARAVALFLKQINGKHHTHIPHTFKKEQKEKSLCYQTH